MADIAPTDVVYTAIEGLRHSSPSDPRMEGVYTVTYGNGVLTYPTGGIPLTGAKLGCPTRIEYFTVIDSNNIGGSTAKFDSSNNKLRVYVSGTELSGGVATPAASTLRVRVVGW